MGELLRWVAPTVVVCMGLLFGCTDDSVNGQLLSAKRLLSERDSKGAAIRLKTLLQAQPDSAEGRFLLGKALLASGDASAAAIELLKAKQLAFPASELAPVLAKALLAQAKYKIVIADFADTVLADTAAAADLRTSVALAFLRSGDKQQAERTLAAVLVAVPNYPAALIAQARLKAVSDDIEGALQLIDLVLKNEPKNAEAWQLKGHFLLYGKNQAEPALSAYRKSLEFDSAGIASHSAIVEEYLARQDLGAAALQLAAMKAVLPGHPQTRYLEALVAVQKRDFKSAKVIAQDLVLLLPDTPRFVLLSGLVELELNALAQAEANFKKVIQLQPSNVSARRLLGQVHLRGGNPSRALEDLQPILTQPNPDVNTLALAGQAHIQMGDLPAAEAMFGLAVKSRPDDALLRTKLALTRQGKDNGDRVVDELSSIAATDLSAVADMALISQLLGRGEFDRALKAIGNLGRKQPTNPVAPYLEGRVNLQQQDGSAARVSFGRALALDPRFFAATAALAATDIAEGKPDAARAKFEAHLKLDPQSVPGLLALAELRNRQRAPRAEVAGLLIDAVRANPVEIASNSRLIEHYLSGREYKLALTSAQQANVRLPYSPEILDLLGRAQLASGDTNQATATFTRLVALQPKSALPYLRLAAVRTAAKSYDGAAQSFRRALEISPELVEAQRGLITLALLAKNSNEAIQIARSIQRRHPDQAVGFLFEGEIELGLNRWDAAVAAFQLGMTKSNPAELPARLYFSLESGKRYADAEKFAAGWLKDHPKDARFIFYLGDQAQSKKDWGLAEQYYRKVALLDPKNALAPNNIAWAMVQQKKPGAVPFAEKALFLVPNSAPYLDTLAWALAEEAQLVRAVEVGKQAVAAAPEHPLHQLTLAKLYLRSGQNDLAKAELEKIVKLGSKFYAQSEVSQLLATLAR